MDGGEVGLKDMRFWDLMWRGKERQGEGDELMRLEGGRSGNLGISE